MARGEAENARATLTRRSPAVSSVCGRVPRERERERGFNQALLLAGHLAAASGLAVTPRWLSRSRGTRPQTELMAGERRVNVARAFSASPRAAGAHVVLVDDIMTTGATVAECARTLRVVGARTVGVLTVARVLAVPL